MSENDRKVEISSENWFRAAQQEQEVKSRIVTLPIEELHPFKDHPFKIRDDDEMLALTQSVQEIGIKAPILVRPRQDGDGYEIVAGHRRTQAAIDADMDGVPAIIEDMDDDTATILMADSNLSQRQYILPSEKAKALKMKLDAIKRQAGRPSKENSAQLGQNFFGQISRDIVSAEAGESSGQVQRIIRLNELIEPLLDSLDAEEIKFTPAVEISYLKEDEQRSLSVIMETEEVSPSLAQAKQLKQLSQQGDLSEDRQHLQEREIMEATGMKERDIRDVFNLDRRQLNHDFTFYKMIEFYLNDDDLKKLTAKESIAFVDIDDDALHKALSMLKRKHRDVIVLHIVYGYSLMDIALMNNTPYSTISSWYYRGLKKMKKLLEKCVD